MDEAPDPLASALFELGLPERVRQGDPLFIAVSLRETSAVIAPSMVTAMGLRLQLRFANGALSPLAPLVAPLSSPRKAPSPGGRQVQGAGPSASPAPETGQPPALGFGTLGIATRAPTGDALAMLMDGDRVLAERGFTIAPRQFMAETIWLDRGLTSMRVDPDPRKTEQAERYLKLIATVDPSAVFLNEGFVRPVAGNRRTSLFGTRRSFRYYGGGEAFSEHAGLDYGYPVGTPIMAAGRGRVVMAEDRIVTGLTVVIEHLPGVYTIYMHLSRMAVSVGDLVERSATIGLLGATGLATGPHLHWELRVLGVASDPEAWIGIDKVPYFRTISATIEGR
jgi:murein DD-endopeptidase MepM/ murein hydrolase activator NlpD